MKSFTFTKIKPMILKAISLTILMLMLIPAFGQIDCSAIPEWDVNETYATKGVQVKYESKVYENQWWTKGENPSQSGPWGVWRYIDDCITDLNHPPSVTITSPVNNTVIMVNTQVTIVAEASDTDGTVTQVEFFVDGNSVGTSGNWTPTSTGIFTLTAVATDDDNASTTSDPVNITVNENGNIPPSVSITSPVNGSKFNEGIATINITANAEDTDGSVVEVKFYNSGTLISTDAAFPYEANISNPANGTYILTAVATDNDGDASTSSAIVVTVGNIVNNEKQVIGYITQWDAWKTTSAGVPSAGALTHLNVDFSKYTILNYSFFGVAQDGSLHSGDFRDKNIYKPEVNQAPNDLFYTDTYSSWDIYILFGETERIQHVNADVVTRATAQGFEVTEGSSTWSHPGWRAYNKPLPLPLHKEGGAPGLLEKAHANGVKVMASIGGWSMCKHFPEMAADPVKRQRFIDDCKLLIDLGFDGIDLDWEYPGPFAGMNFTGTEADYENFAILIEEIRVAIGPDKLITAAMSAAPAKLQGFNWPRLNNTMDYFNMMTYDFNGGWSNIAGHNSPLYPYTGAEADFSWQRTLEALDALGVPRNKVNMGIPFYGRGVICDGSAGLNVATVKRNETIQPDGPVVTCADYTNWPKEVYDGTPNYFFIKQKTGLGTSSGWTRYWDDEAKVPYMTNGQYFLSYDDLESIELKSQYIVNNQLAGTIVWTVYGDLEFGGTVTNHDAKLKSWSNMSHELIDKVNDVFGGTNNNIPPTVSIPSPANGSIYDKGVGIELIASASDQDGTITKVEFFANGTSIGSDNTSPYSITWQNAPVGAHDVTAIATDNAGATKTSTKITLTVNDTSQPSGYKILMYVTSWSGNAADYDYSKVTHLNYSFAVPNSDGTIPAPDNAAKLQDVVTRAHAQGVKVCLAIGGWLNSSPSNTPFETFSQTETGRTNFASACADFIQQYNLDGIDIDWEYPQVPANWNSLIAVVRQAIGPDKLLTAAVAGSDYFGKGFGSESFTHLDFINIMAYDCSCPTNAPYDFAVSALDYWVGRGMPANKCVLGVPFYTEDNTPALHTQKANHVKSAGAAGMMAWELANDTDGSQLNAIYTALNGSNPQNPVANPNGPYTANEGQAISFSSAGSSDPDGSITTYLWEFGDNNTSSLANPSHTYTQSGTYTVTLTVTDNDNNTVSASTIATVTTVGGCTAPAYVENGGYDAGSSVENNGIEYECKPFPYSGWCNGQAWAYEPGVGQYWTDAWTEIGPCTSKNGQLNKNIQAIFEDQVYVYPNPFSNELNITITLQAETKVDIKLYNTVGKEIQTIAKESLCKGDHNLEIDGSQLKAGIYIYKIRLNNAVYTGNLIKN